MFIMFKLLVKKIVVYILTFEAKIILSRKTPKIIAITGSAGKTTVKDATAQILSSAMSVHKSEKSYNSEFGVPLAILGLESGWDNALRWVSIVFRGLLKAFSSEKYPEWLVLEIGVDHPGDMERIVSWLKPDVVVLTSLPEVPVHVEFFSSPSAVTAEKMKLVRALKSDGLLVLNADDERVMSETEASLSTKITYGFNEEADIRAKGYRYMKQNKVVVGVSATVEKKGSETKVLKMLNVVGRQHILALLAGIAVGVSQKVSVEAAVNALEEYQPPNGRMRLIEGIKQTLIIDDSYNSSPIALESALKTLSDISVPGKKIAILGDMLELGNYTVPEHKKAGEVARTMLDYLVTVGVRSLIMEKSAREGGMDSSATKHFDDARLAGKHVEELLDSGDIVLVKGSQSMRMERAVKEMMAYPDQARRQLVRQEREWETKH
jgi:UDP-N-acetylmuramoyl-tripeptide--D-alanyl-D-alanine ligase